MVDTVTAPARPHVAPPPPAGRAGMGRLERRLLVGCVAAGVVLRVVLAVPTGGPILSEDALGYLANARWLAGVAEPDLRDSNLYGFGYSLVLAPLHRLGLGPAGVVAAAQVLNACFAAAVVVPLAGLLRRLWPGLGARAWWVGLVVSLTPALVLQPAFVWPETLLPLLFATWVLAVHRLFDTRRVVDPFAVALLAVALLAVHQRAVAVVGATVVALLVGVVVAWPARRRAGACAAALAVVLAGGVAVRAATAQQVEALWRAADPSNAEQAGTMLGRLAPAYWDDLLASALGQSWYLAVSTIGLAVVGGVVLVGRVRPLLTGDASARRASVPDGVVLVAVLGSAAVSVLFMAAQPRVDHLLYGRYNELWSPVVVAIGLGWLLRQAPGRRVRVAAAAGAATFAVGGLLLLVVGGDRLTGPVQLLTVVGVVGWQALVEGGLGVGIDRVAVPAVSAVAVAGLAATAVGGSRRDVSVLAAAGALFVTASVLGHVGALQRFRADWLDHLTVLVDAVEASDAPDDATIAYDHRSFAPEGRNGLAFWLGDDRLVAVDGLDEVEELEPTFVVSGDDALARRCYGQVAEQPVAEQRLWRRDDACARGAR